MRIPTSEPTEFTAGDSLAWDRILSGYPAEDGWSFQYVLSGAHPTPINISTTAQGNRFEVRLSSEDTEQFTPGSYHLIGYATRGSDRCHIYRGSATVHPDYTTAVPEESHAQKMVGLLEQAMLGVAESGIVEYTVAGRGVKKVTLEEARRELAFWRNEVAKEQAPPNKPRSPFRRVEVAFAPMD